MIYAYCRVSTKHQRIARQITNITELYPHATIIREFYTGTTQNRPQWDKLISTIKKEDTIVFDSVSRMSRNPTPTPGAPAIMCVPTAPLAPCATKWK